METTDHAPCIADQYWSPPDAPRIQSDIIHAGRYGLASQDFVTTADDAGIAPYKIEPRASVKHIAEIVGPGVNSLS